MKYMGSKARFASEIFEKTITLFDGRPYVEPFGGGMNMIAEVPDVRPCYANDSNKYLIAMWKALQEGWVPDYYDRDFYQSCKRFEQPDHVVGYVGFNCSYSGKWFGGYAGETKTKDGLRDYQKEAFTNIMKQVNKLKNVVFSCGSYDEMYIPDEAVIYCDPPYSNTTGYKDQFDSNKFWNWVRDISKTHNVFISEYSAPDDFEIIWEKTVKSSLSANGKSGGNKESIERLFKLKH